MSNSNCCFLTCIQISQEAGQVVWYSHLLKNFPQFVVINTVKGFGIVNKEEVDAFLEFFCFFYDPADICNLISGSSAFSKSSLNIWKFTVHVLLKTGLENFEHYFAIVWDELNCAVVSTFFGIAFPWDWNENCPFSVLWSLLNFPNLLAYFLLLFFKINNRRIIALQCCVHSCYITMRISHKYVCVPSLRNLPPSPSHSTPLDHHSVPGWASCAI